MSDRSCNAVDTGLFIYSTGEVKVCCSGSYTLGNIQNQSLGSIFNSKQFIELRQEISENKVSKYCSSCDKIDSVDPALSQRHSFNSQFKFYGERKLKLLDIRWSNVCNLACRYCKASDSSEWSRLLNIPVENVNKDYIESVYEEISRNKDTIDCVYLLGGEPLLQKHNERLLDIINPNVKLDLLTNLSVKLSQNKIYNKLKKYPNTYWNLSFDTVGERFEYVRQNASWATMLSNIQTVKSDFGTDHIMLHPVYSIWNATNLKEFYDFADQHNFIIKWQLALPRTDQLKTDSFVTFGHNKRIIDLAIKEIESLGIVDSSLENIKNRLMSDTVDPAKSAKFLSWTSRMEQLLPPNKPFADLWPELNTLLNTP